MLNLFFSCANTEASTEQKVEKSIEVSRNAQFRAIQPSPAILSFVEDNVLIILVSFFEMNFSSSSSSPQLFAPTS